MFGKSKVGNKTISAKVEANKAKQQTIRGMQARMGAANQAQSAAEKARLPQGIAARLAGKKLAMGRPQLGDEGDRPNYLTPEADRWAGLNNDFIALSLERGSIIFVESSAIAYVQYFGGDNPTGGDFLVKFHDGTYRYRYHHLPVAMVIDFFEAVSKGVWVGDRLVKTNWPFTRF